MYYCINPFKLNDAWREVTHRLSILLVDTNFSNSTATTTTFMSTGSCTHADDDETLHSLTAKVLPPVFCCTYVPNFKFLI
jgi:hypothetical protein